MTRTAQRIVVVARRFSVGADTYPVGGRHPEGEFPSATLEKLLGDGSLRWAPPPRAERKPPSTPPPAPEDVALELVPRPRRVTP